jgi:hypothetical protein
MDAARTGQLPVLQWAHENKQLINIRKCIGEAASGGHISTMNWLLELIGWEFDPDYCERAVAGDQLFALMWLYALGCPIGKAAMKLALIHDKKNILEWFSRHEPERYLELMV